MLWSPDGQFLAMCSESAGGNSPWHFISYFWSCANGKFRSIDDITGPVVSDEIAFISPHSLTVRIAETDSKGGLAGFDFEHPISKTVDLDQLRHKEPALRPCLWP